MLVLVFLKATSSSEVLKFFYIYIKIRKAEMTVSS